MTQTLSQAALDMLLQLSREFQTDRFSEEAAGELAALGYATRRSVSLVVTDKGVLALRDYQARTEPRPALRRRPKAIPWMKN